MTPPSTVRRQEPILHKLNASPDYDDVQHSSTIKKKKKSFHPYDMQNPDFLNSQKKAYAQDKMMHELNVPFEDLPNFLKPTINFGDKIASNESSTSKALNSLGCDLDIRKNKGAMFNWIEKSVCTSNPIGKSDNLLTGAKFDKNKAVRAVEHVIYLASRGADAEMDNIEWRLTFGMPIGVPPGTFIDPNMEKKNRLRDKKERMQTLETLCNKKAKSVCGDRDYHIFNQKPNEPAKKKDVHDCIPKFKTKTIVIARFEKNWPNNYDQIRRTNSASKLEIELKETFGEVKGEGVKIKFNDNCARKIKEAMGVEIDSEDSFDKDFTIFRDLRNIEI